jgi:DNA-directed RNA polymerase subunit RPC12/RpoP
MNVDASSQVTSGAIQTYTCGNCGASTSFDPGTRTLRCPFCGSEMAVRASGAALPTITAPQYVLPFKIDKEASATTIREWLGDSFFAPGDLKSRSAIDRGQGTYVPFWRFDAETSSEWEGEVSQTQNRRVQRSFTDNGRTETRWVDEPYTTWHPRSGHHDGKHRTYVCASTGLTQAEADQLMPFPEEAMMTYSEDLLVGFGSEEPGTDEAGAWESGEQRIRELARGECEGEVERLTRVDTRVFNQNSAVCYLPVWLYTYAYQGQNYRVLVNGYTAEIVGDRPVSKGKIVLVIAAVVAVIAIIAVLYLVFG